MKVMKFGGKVLGSARRMQQVTAIVTDNSEPVFVVVSALSGTSGRLREIAEAIRNNRRNQAKSGLTKLETFYHEFINELLTNDLLIQETTQAISKEFAFLQFSLQLSFSEALQKDILARGEVLSTILLSATLREKSIDHAVLNALDFMQTDKFGEPLIGSIKVKLTQQIEQHPGKRIYITQGNHCRNMQGEVDNLGQGGSDYTASAIAAALQSPVCEIWSDIPIMQNIDPSISTNTTSVHTLSFEEAAELAYFNEKVLHPASIWPARLYNIPVKMLNTQDPINKGTLVTTQVEGKGAKVVAARDGVVFINVKSSRMLMAFGFLQRILDVFEKYQTSIDTVATSEVAVSLTTDNSVQLHNIAKDLEAFGVVTYLENQTLISIVGNELLHQPNVLSSVFAALNEVPLQIISYGGSKHNVSMLVPTAYKQNVLHSLREVLFN